MHHNPEHYPSRLDWLLCGVLLVVVLFTSCGTSGGQAAEVPRAGPSDSQLERCMTQQSRWGSMPADCRDMGR